MRGELRREVDACRLAKNYRHPSEGKRNTLEGGGDSQPIDSTFSFTTPAPYNDNNWHNAVLIFSSAEKVKESFMDGTMIDSIYAPLNVLTDGFQIPLSFGRQFITGWNAPQCYFNGKIDDIRIYRRALTKYDVDTLFH